MQNHEQELNRIKQGLETAKNMKIRAEAKKDELLRKREEIERECQELGISVDQLEGEIARLEQEIAKNLAEADHLIPWELVNKG